MIEHGNNKNFDELIKNDIVLVDFYAEWCGPCKMLSPILEELSSDRKNIKIIKINVDEEENLARKFGVMSIPTLILFKDGIETDKKIGYMNKEELINWIK